MRPSKWLVFIRPFLAGFDRPLTMVDLITMVNSPAGWSLQAAEGINASGWIVGYGLKSGQTRAFLLTPNF